MEISFEGQVAIVTGAGGGLGRTYALELARREACVVVNDAGVNKDGTGEATRPADETVAEIRAAGGAATASHDSVTTSQGGAAIIEQAVDTYGRVDIVINNAGILRDRSFAKLDDEDLHAVLDVHLLGAFNVSRPAFRIMKERGYGRFLFTTSSAGLFGNFGQSNYAAAKMALVGLSNVLALEGAPTGIKSNVIAPAARSRLTEGVLGDLADSLSPELVTPLALFLVSDACDLSHEVFCAGGGRFARVFLGMTRGWIAPPGTTPTVEDVRDHVPAIRDEADYIVPTSLEQETRLLIDLVAEGLR